MVESSFNMLVVDFITLTLDRIDRHLFIGDKGRSHIILGAEWVRGAEYYISASSRQGAHQVSSLRGDVQTGTDADPSQWPLFGETLADQPQYRHLLLGPIHTLAALLS